ncbi:hypothetical protein KY305_10350 [Bacillus sp. YC2]|uniref:hypothetical protein n=1 Tax=Bacillus sp. YC2 TaxID=2861287 RepID=UPI001CA672F8|nr:hypothetical protein [Bacillus sp. YC2]MBY8913138.1 hypothetical protein [Bacillus sp. YC2]
MNFKKVLTGSALSLALLVSAAPAFAAGPANSSITSTQGEASAQLIKDSFTQDFVYRSNIPNVTIKNGYKYYLKSVEVVEGFYRATYEGWID